jgi:hypothetical protein
LIRCLFAHRNEAVQWSAAEALGNLAFNYEGNKNHIRKTKGLSNLLKCCSYMHAHIRKLAMLAILLLSESHKTNTQELLKLNVINVFLIQRNFRYTKNYAELGLAIFVLSGLDGEYRKLKSIKLKIERMLDTLEDENYRARYVAISLILRLSESELYQAELKELDVCTRMSKLLKDEHLLVKDRARLALDHLTGGGRAKAADCIHKKESLASGVSKWKGDGISLVSKAVQQQTLPFNSDAATAAAFTESYFQSQGGGGGGGGAKESALPRSKGMVRISFTELSVSSRK